MSELPSSIRRIYLSSEPVLLKLIAYSTLVKSFPRRATSTVSTATYLFKYRTPSVWCAPPMNPSELIDKYIADLTDWRGKMLANLRKIIHDAAPEIIEEWKWMGSPSWSHDGLILVANAHKDKVKLTFSQGASLPDPDKLFNAGLEGNKWRAVDFHEGDRIDEGALKNIIRAAVAHNRVGLKGKTSAGARGIRPKVRKK